ncbi:MAG: DUF1707 SHOCT-like domain-containing protein [Solirubrobacteraceae bacterium]
MDEQRAPALRASDADRERSADMLRHAAGEGRLTIDELDERLSSAYEAQTRAELERLTADVLVASEEAHPASAPAQRLPVRPGEGGARWLVAIMGGSERKGHWRVAARCTLVNLMGGSDIDLNDAELAAERIEMRVFSIMGGSDIRVPEGLNVEVSEFAFMGGNGVDVGNARPDAGGPVLHLRLFSLMGGTDVKRGRKLTREERRREKELERSRHQRLGH